MFPVDYHQLLYRPPNPFLFGHTPHPTIISHFTHTYQETERLIADPAPGIHAVPHDDNLRHFDVLIDGPGQSPFEGEFRFFELGGKGGDREGWKEMVGWLDGDEMMDGKMGRVVGSAGAGGCNG